MTFALSVALVALNGFKGEWWIYIFRFLIIFSSIIPISLRVNLDMGKTVYARQIMHDDEIPAPSFVHRRFRRSSVESSTCFQTRQAR